jgi:SAM-dependent methyltransferase
VELARRGHELAGADICEEFLDEARAASAANGLAIDWRSADMRALPWTDTFDAAISFGTSFAFFDEAGNLDSCVAVQRALKPGGVFIVDTAKLMEIILPAPKLRGWVKLDDILLTYENHYDFATGFERTDYRLYRNGEVEEKSARQRIYTFHELCCLMQRAGFSECRGYSTLDMRPLRLGLNRLLLVATK